MGRIERFILWAGTLHASDQLLFLGSILFGVLALMSGMMTENYVFILIGVVWVVGGPLVVRIGANRK